VRSRGGSLACRRSRDPRISECRGTIRLPPDSTRFAVTVSLVDDSAAVVILSGSVPRDTVRAWVEAIALTQGIPSLRVGGPQRTWQWIRRRQMLRLIHRRDGSRETAVITLTDGPLLDGLARP
jgi:hypothetical protein